MTFLSPLFKKSQSLQSASRLLEQVPDDGLPHSFPVVTDRVDAWTKYPAQRVGSVYLIRQPGEEKPIALTAKCPHAGCFIGYNPGDDFVSLPMPHEHVQARWHARAWRCRSGPRGMDHLPVELSRSNRPTATRTTRCGSNSSIFKLATKRRSRRHEFQAWQTCRLARGSFWGSVTST